MEPNKILIALLVTVVCVSARPQKKKNANGPPEDIIPIVEYNFDRQEDSYKYNYKTGDGTEVREVAQVIPGEKEDEGSLRVEGSYSYTAPDGQVYTVMYVADENGFQPVGTHLPGYQSNS